VKKKKGISPFISTLILVAITIALGTFLFTQFRNLVVSQVKTASLTVIDSNVGVDGRTFTVVVKNDGNIPLLLRYAILSYNGLTQNVTLRFLSGNSSGLIKPGEESTLQFTSQSSIQPFTSYTVTIVSDKVARSFEFQS
jgi:flagellin-like protein